ncbi:hypothetical protein HDV57DRAFT_21689 [Trichoderma longibrachiatum]|uniref:Uncharacterized protein n=1 Tax=Trichoderma longibrachiatum ATCC 18648 TaxID=983965 RepID=A0A2T4CIN8_TRILO|nr:hypothetical protein M440DRAFT_1015038 [Trichoderma longibrachiatum ATCC 18648]
MFVTANRPVFHTNPSSPLLPHQPGGAVVALLPIRPFLRIPLASSVLHVKLVFSAPHPSLRSTTPTDSFVHVPGHTSVVRRDVRRRHCPHTLSLSLSNIPFCLPQLLSTSRSHPSIPLSFLSRRTWAKKKSHVNKSPSLKAASRLSQEKTIPVPPPFVLKGGPLSAVEPPAGPRHWPAWRCLSPTRQVQCP